MSIKPLLNLFFLAIFAGQPAFAAPGQIPGQAEALSTVASIRALLAAIEKGGPGCTQNYHQSQCPSVVKESISASVVQPEKTFFTNMEKDLKDLDIQDALQTKAVAGNLEKTNIDTGAIQAELNEINPRLKDLTEAKAKAAKMLQSIEAKSRHYFENDPKVKTAAVNCAQTKGKSESDVMGFCKSLSNKLEGFSCIFRKIGMIIDPGCSPDVEKNFQTFAARKIPELKSQLISLNKYLSDKVADLAKQKTALEARLAQKPAEDKNKSEEKPIVKTEPKKAPAPAAPAEKSASVAEAPKPAPAPAAPKVAEPKPAPVESAPVAEADPEPEAESASVAKPKSESSANDMAESVLSTMPPPAGGASYSLPTDPIDTGSTQGHASNADSGNEIETDREPSADSEEIAVEDLSLDEAQESPATGRKLDLSNQQDTTFIQQALNEVNGDSNIKVDGRYGSQTAAALEAVMEDEAKKEAFEKALRELMAR